MRTLINWLESQALNNTGLDLVVISVSVLTLILVPAWLLS